MDRKNYVDCFIQENFHLKFFVYKINIFSKGASFILYI
jgi:hypothetical protein